MPTRAETSPRRKNVSFTKSFAKFDLDGDSRLYWKDIDAKAPTELLVTMFSLPI